MPRAIDCWVNTGMGDSAPPEFLKRVAEDYFKRSDVMFRSFTPDQLREQMDAAGVEKAVLTLSSEAPSAQVLAFPKADPERFVLSVSVDPRRGMKAVRELEALVRNEPVVLARVVPFMVGLIPPNDYRYFPLYTKCIEWKLPVSINTGLPGPPMPGRCQDPMHLDEVCYYLPELVIVMAHGADPWWNVAIRLMVKYRNLYLMTSAYAPKYFPPELIQFMNTRGKHKILFASDHPVLDFGRCVAEAQELPLREGVLDLFLYENANRLFFSEKAGRER
jgi:predicted TIM-barrel fold metal-dependent hydrolase